jgi:hypothetical protein
VNCNEANVRRALKIMCRSVVVFATMFFAASPLLAQTPAITGVRIAYGIPTPSTNTITIIGNFFNPKGIAPTVVIGVTALTVTPGFTNTKIVATLPNSLAAGAYLLTVMNHPYSNSGVFVVNNGKVGLQGQGPTGLARAKAALGKTGKTPTNGTSGAAGPASSTEATAAMGSVSISSLCSVLFPNATPGDCAGTGAATKAQKIVFVTTGAYAGNLSGTASGNAICQKEAESAGLAGNYKAWLSTAVTGDNSPQSLTQISSTLPSGYIPADGVTPVATTQVALITPALRAGSAYEVQGVSPASRLTTGDQTAPNSPATAAAECGGWTISTSGANGLGGAYAGATPSTPDALQEHEIVECGPAHYLYCIQQ